MKKIITCIILLAFSLTLFFFSDEIFLLSIRWIPRLSVTTAFWVPLVMSLIIGIIALVIFSKELNTIFKKTLAGLCLIVLCSFTFFSNPLYPEDFENRFNTLIIDEEISEIYMSDIQTGTTCYLLVDCPFCEIASKKLNLLYEAGKIDDIEFVYHAYPKTADSLVKANYLSIPYRTIEDDSIFFLRAGSNFPSIQLVSSGELFYWSGNDVNFACFDFLMANKKD